MRTTRSRAIVPDMIAATDDDYAAEFLDLILAVRIVDNVDAAIAHVRQFGSDHTEVIVTRDAAACAASDETTGTSPPFGFIARPSEISTSVFGPRTAPSAFNKPASVTIVARVRSLTS